MGEFFDKAKGEVSNATQAPNNANQFASESPAHAEPLFAEESVAPSAIDAGPTSPAVTTSTSTVPVSPNGIPSPCDNTAPGSHVEAACHGPTADNPSLSIQKRLKRARFFDQRELLVAAGEAAPMEADAGLPDALEVPEEPQG